MKIYFGDLTHTTITISNDSFPLNVGYVAAATRTQYPGLKFQIFKYPEDLRQALLHEMPDILALSNYPWNLDLGLSFFKFAKELNPKTITVMGGPNIGYSRSEHQRFFEKCRGCLDFYATFEGEASFLSLLDALIECGGNADLAKRLGIEGCLYISDGDLCELKTIRRARDLSGYPSPYLTGILDSFFDGILSPMVETHRGCPYQCTFCHEGHDFYRKVARFEQGRLLQELDYIGDRIGSKVSNMLIADPNFGMFKEHLEFAEKLVEVRRRTGFPKVVFATTAKNSQRNLLAINEIFGDDITMPIWMSVQSMTPNVLENIKRRNISLHDMLKIQRSLSENSGKSKSELIMCLPGESLQTHIDALVQLMDLGIDQVVTYQLMVVNGSDMQEDLKTHRKEFGFKTKFRVLPRSFSKIDPVGDSLEIEEIVVQTRDFSFEDYLEARKLHLVNAIFYNGNAFEGYFRYFREQNISSKSFLIELLEGMKSAPELGNFLDDFIHQTRMELFDCEDSAREFYLHPNNFDDLITGKVGGNLMQQFSSIAYIDYNQILVRIAETAALKAISASPVIDTAVIRDITQHYAMSFKNFIDPNRCQIVDNVNFRYDIPAWLRSTKTIDDFRSSRNLNYVYWTPENSFRLVEDFLDRYGDDAQSMGKILTRLWVTDLFRKPEAIHAVANSRELQNSTLDLDL